LIATTCTVPFHLCNTIGDETIHAVIARENQLMISIFECRIRITDKPSPLAADAAKKQIPISGLL
jgi:hypothetical protein